MATIPVTSSAPTITEPASLESIVASLRSLPVLEGLSDAEYLWLASNGQFDQREHDTLIFKEQEPVRTLHILLQGEVHVRRSNTGPFAVFTGRAGSLTGKLPFSRMKYYGGDGWAVGTVRALNFDESLFPAMLAAIPSMAQRCVSILLDRVREVTRLEQQGEKLSALGKLAGNLAHELNNPASAAQRIASTLLADLKSFGELAFHLGTLNMTAEQYDFIVAWGKRVRQQPRETLALSASDHEEALLLWLTAHQVPEPWRLAPALAECSVQSDQLDELASAVPGVALPQILAVFATSMRVERMAATVIGSTARIFDLISAIKDYSYMDQAPLQEVDLAHSLENTLAMLQSRLAGITVETSFDSSLPPISAYGSELNQVWTALLENALDALDGKGTLRLITRCAGNMAVVEIWNSGPTIDPAIRSRIFEPFFTTKAPGAGLGLGLDIAQRVVSRHSGFITVESRPGATCFQIRLRIKHAGAY